MTRPSFDMVFLYLGAAILVSAFVVSSISKEAFFTWFGAEDSLIENFTAIGLACAGAVLIARILRDRRHVTGAVLALGLLYGLAYIWAAGEEISWGQRILGFDSPEYFQQNNDQQEFTFHNLTIGDVRLDESLFGPVLSTIILSYLLLLPLLWLNLDWVRRLTRAMVIPVPQLHHAGFALFVTAAIPFLEESRRWEVYECIFALLSMAIFLYPANPLHQSADKA
ncbi:hypothetical protein [Marivita sp. GX14005]|uniref:hypothetical protein n=1 Tax=Marivita sp. GX14005 TaxID=2942276 RepID=UPI002018512C|nr:hypothetical protein [Marivita sp. GX14005]MCL3880978.1 hypothetical protein [Marivita sp. GX14005]